MVLAGTRDLESYEHAFVSLPRGTAIESVQVLGQPVYTLALGFGVRLPLQGSLGASPAAATARFVPAPVAYWLMLAFSIASALLVVRHALEPRHARPIVWMAAVLLFCSVPVVTCTILNDWPDVALTYCAFVTCAFAPQALLSIVAAHGSPRARIAGGLAVGGIVFGAIALSHAGYWPHIALTLVCSALLALLRTEFEWRDRLGAVAFLAAVSLSATVAQVPDILRELNIPGAETAALGRYTEPPEGSLIAANLFPFGEFGSRLPFSHLLLAVVTLVLGFTLRDGPARRLSIGGAAVAIALGIAATVPGGSAPYSPTSVWSLRDPAAAFAVLAAATAAGALMRRRARVPSRPALAVLFVAALQGPSYAAALVFEEPADQLARLMTLPGGDQGVWTRDVTPPGERAYDRGMPKSIRPTGERVALWPGVRQRMRTDRAASTDIADAGFSMTSAWTKQRTMRALVRPNELLFNQTTDLSVDVLCSAAAVEFLQLRYLLAPVGADVCSVWTPVRGVEVDGRHGFYKAAVRDEAVRALAAPVAADAPRIGPALSPESDLIPNLQSLPGSAVTINGVEIAIQLREPADAAGRILVLPVAWDPAWRSSAGDVQNIGGLLAVAGVTVTPVRLRFVPDTVAWLRAAAMTLAQLASLAGFAGLVYMRPTRDESYRERRDP